MNDQVIFPDRGLHVGVLGALLDRGLISRAEIVAGFDTLTGTGQQRLTAALDGLHARALPAGAVAAIERLDFDGGNSVYMAIEGELDYDTGGETDDHNVGSLAGLGALAALRDLSLEGHGYRTHVLDLAPLTGCSRISRLYLTGSCSSAQVLEALPNLRELNVRYARLDDPAVPERLRSRGVLVYAK
ncbi:DUF6892 domain-containing protein [Dactylosporangium sp. CS-047395]|uniref:DUF6892 domain-containing protein n=1 Tax=Dactylosporangium sp. CS-047395 TaxID=3239936 RepID=UPI003D942138